MGLIPDQLRRRARVLGGRLWIGALEFLGPRGSHILTARSSRRRLARAKRELKPLRRWSRISESSFASYTGAPSMVRIDRLRGLLSPGSRILDIGIGFGYVTGILLRDIRPERYLGIDIKELFIDATKDMIDQNDLDAERAELAVGDVFHLDADLVARTDPDTVLLLEVLEHVDSPEIALRSVASVVNSGATIIFTVPLKDRLDGVWGHVSAFDIRRVRRLCRAAALEIERVEAIHNTWTLVVARRTDDQLPPPPLNGYELPSNTFRTLEFDPPSKRYRRPGDAENVKLRASGTTIRCKAEPDGGPVPEIGMRIPVIDPRIARADLRLRPEHLKGFLSVHALDAEGGQIASWRGELDSIPTRRSGRFTLILRPGRDFAGLKAHGRRSARGIGFLEFALKVRSSEKATLLLQRAAYLEEGPR